MGVRVSAIVEATPAQVWAYVEQVERHGEWMADADAIRFETEQRRGVGTRFVCDTRVGPLRLADRMEITAWEPPRLMAVRHTGLVHGSGRFTIDPADATSTRFTWDEHLAFPWYLGGPVGARVAGATVLKWIWRRNLRRLKRRIEQPR